MQKGIKFRIYPNREQQNLINQTLGCCRLIYNKGLAMRNEAYENGNKIGYSQTSSMLTELKKCEDFAFLKVVDSIALQQSLRDLDRGFLTLPLPLGMGSVNMGISSTAEVVSSIIVLPKIIAKYLFNKKEEDNKRQIISNMQTYNHDKQNKM